MDKMKDLVEQHILQSVSHLRHIDELMAKARTAALTQEAAARAEALLRQTESDRNKLAQELQEIQRLPSGEGSETVKKAEGLRGLLASVGLQLEQALGAIFEQGK